MEALAIVEVLGRRGEVIHRERLHRLPAVVGRGYDADLIVDDPHVAARHLRVEAAGEQEFKIVDLGTKNGFTVLGRRSPKMALAEEKVPSGTVVRLGHTQLRIWHPQSSVAEEIPGRRYPGTVGITGFIAWLTICLGLTGLFAWLDASGPASEGQVGQMMLAAAAGLFIWSGFWWLASPSSQRNDVFIAHGSIAARMLFLVISSMALISTASFAFDFYPKQGYLVDDVLLWAVLSHGIYCHLRLLSRRRAWVLLAQASVIVAVVMVPLEYTMLAIEQDKVGTLNLPSTLRPPWMRVAKGVSPAEFLK